jgi:hypothetical protein
VGQFEYVDYQDGFYQHEVDNLARLLNVIKAEDPNKRENVVARHDFYLYIQEHDKRNGTNFKEVFPEMVTFVDRCQREYEVSKLAKEIAKTGNYNQPSTTIIEPSE